MGISHNMKLKKALKQLEHYHPKHLGEGFSTIKHFDKVNNYAKKRIKIIQILKQLKDERAIEPLASILKYYKSHPKLHVMIVPNETDEIFACLAEIGNKKAIPIIRDYLGKGFQAGASDNAPFGKALLKLGDPELLELQRRREESIKKRRWIAKIMSDRSELSKLLTSLEIIPESDPLHHRFRYKLNLEETIDAIHNDTKKFLPSFFDIDTKKPIQYFFDTDIYEKKLIISYSKYGFMSGPDQLYKFEKWNMHVYRLGQNHFSFWKTTD